MKKSKLLALLLTISILLAILTIYNYSYKRTPTKYEESTTESIYFNNQEALYLRKAFNEYLKSPTNTSNGLNDYSKSYYNSPFVVYEENNSLAGGKQLEIIFVDKPDKMFTAWVYKLATGDYELKGFGQNTKVIGEELEKIRIKYNEYFENSRYYY